MQEITKLKCIWNESLPKVDSKWNKSFVSLHYNGGNGIQKIMTLLPRQLSNAWNL